MVLGRAFMAPRSADSAFAKTPTPLGTNSAASSTTADTADDERCSTSASDADSSASSSSGAASSDLEARSASLHIPSGACISTCDQLPAAVASTPLQVPQTPAAAQSPSAINTSAKASLASACNSTTSSDAADDTGSTPGGVLEESAFISLHGLSRCTAVRELGAGSLGRVELVSVLLADGATTRLCARKTVPRKTAAEDRAVAFEMAGLRAGAGTRHAV
ncbi:hypothetical protein TSOC_004338 [Tetrabaena socialis]|uniref:Protein kinase domain-containing protein n=1 Tax=Tetrabaena socialis TaxID=47790 RepID=A0A2J8A982_9CHLO|nr:hypothetical protein TSOC_004338 [Tetrabaena socialis]|eukprot:PNH09087.1 hypothetical protein TSOC_004338 [Tetrabaena socialis]